MVAQARDGGTIVHRRLGADGARDEPADDRQGIISPFTRHPVQVAMDARVVQEAAGPGRFLLGFGTSKIFLNNARMQTRKTLGPMRDAVAIVRGVLSGEAFRYEGETWSADVPALRSEAETPREVPPVYVAATAPKMQALAGEIGDGCLTPSITTPAFVRYTRENVAADIDIGCTVIASIRRVRPRPRPRRCPGDRRDVPREQVPEHQGIRLHSPRAGGHRDGPLAPSRRRWSAAVDSLRRSRCPTRCSTGASRSRALLATASRRSRSTVRPAAHVMLELWGDRRHDQLRLFGERVLPHFRR